MLDYAQRLSTDYLRINDKHSYNNYLWLLKYNSLYNSMIRVFKNKLLFHQRIATVSAI